MQHGDGALLGECMRIRGIECTVKCKIISIYFTYDYALDILA